jgi:hypothetical protein
LRQQGAKPNFLEILPERCYDTPEALPLRIFYKVEGFETNDGYAAVPWGKNRLVIIYNGQQLTDVGTIRQANKFIKEHRMNPQEGTVFVN